VSERFNIRCLALACALIFLIAVARATAPTISVKDAGDHVGEYITVEGRVANVFTSRAGNTFLNFGAAHPHQIFSATVFERYADAFADEFGDLADLEGKRVRITGKLKVYQGKPQIILESTSQLAVD
jgi:DNA/RNA endonuclease YhcR with UshA esterase domain